MNLPLIHTPAPSDLDRQRGLDAYRNISFSPDKRAYGDIDGYVEDVLAFAEMLESRATTPEKAAVAIEQVEQFRLRYISWEYTLWAAKARTASPMITGPARFPVERNRKAIEAEFKKYDAFKLWLDRAKAAAIKAVDNVGYVATPKPEGTPSGLLVTFDGEGIKAVENFDMDRVQILFDGKPTEEERAILKGEAFKWAPSQKAWQRQLTDNARRAVKRVISRLIEQP